MTTAPAPGRRRSGPSIGDVARLAGVSPQTVSRVSTGADSVRPSTRAKVVQAMDQLGYSPNRAAQALRNGTFGAIGVLSTGFQRTSPGMVGTSCSGSDFQRVLKPNGVLHAVMPDLV